MTTREEFEAWYEADNTEAAWIKPFAWSVWQASRTAALEEAAKECDLMAEHYTNNFRIDSAEQCAMGIRALKGE